MTYYGDALAHAENLARIVRDGVFIASPFFNEEQLTAVKLIEQKLEEKGIQYFSARKHSKVRPDGTRVERKKAFLANCKGIDEKGVMLAITDWLLPMPQEMRILEIDPWNLPAKPGDVIPAHIKSDRIFIPDVGTVFEIGYATAKQKPVVGFRIQPKVPLNLMLVEAFEGMIFSFDELEEFLKPYPNNFNWKGLKTWKENII